MYVRITGVLDFVNCAHFDNTTIIQHGNSVGHLESTHHVVSHHHGRHAKLALHIENQVVDHVAGNGVQTRSGFVVQKDFRVQGDGAGKGHTLAHTARKFRRHLGTEFRHKVDHLELFGHHVLNFFFAHFGVMFAQGKRNIFARVHGVKKGAHLEQHAHLAANRMGIKELGRTDSHAVHRHFAAIGLQKPNHML